MFKKRKKVAHTCNPSFSGVWRSGGLRFEASLGKYFHKILSRKNPSQKRVGGVAQGGSSEFKSQYHTHKKEILLHFEFKQK
jgi:hypothetical protein